MTKTNVDKYNIIDEDNFETLSTFVGKIAHDYNNLITPFLAYPQLIKSELGEYHKASDLLDIMKKSAFDMSHLTEQLLSLSTKIRSEFTEDHLDKIISTVVTKQKANIKQKNINIELTFNSNLPPFKCDSNIIATAIDNLISNSIDSIDSEGTIRIATSMVNVLNEMVEDLPVNFPGKYFCIVIADNGIGIPEKIKDKLFYPFVTTKKESHRVRGAGLGLSIVYNAIKRHNGVIDIQSEENKGTIVTIYLPFDIQKPESEPISNLADSITTSSPASTTNQKRILLVDDEKIIVKLFKTIVETALPEYLVETAENGLDALNKFKEHHHTVIVMDLHMPVMDGHVAFMEIEKYCKENNLNMPSVIFCTGFAPPATISKVVDQNPKHFIISKPVKGEVIVDAIKRRI